MIVAFDLSKHGETCDEIVRHREGITQTYYCVTEFSHNTAACSKTVWVAFACLSGG